MAVNAGADLVIELPFLYACNSAKDFSRGAVEILARTNFVDNIAFGMEDINFDVEPLINLMLNENQDYKNFLHQELKSGASFAKSNSKALEKILQGSSEFISQPNNMLALSYMLEIKKHDYNLKPLKFKREGIFKSKLIREEKNFEMMSDFSREIFFMAEKSNENKLWPLLQNIFIRTSSQELQNIYGIDEGIENLFLKHWKIASCLEDFIGKCVCARYTRSHIRRRLIYILLGLQRSDVKSAMNEKIPYARILAFNENGRKILRNNSDIKLVTRLSKEKNFFSQTEYKASQLYELTLNHQNFSRESNTVLKFS